MAKEGLDSFLLDCQRDDKLKLIEAEFGIKGFAVVVRLFQKIYGERGYYCEWNDDVGLLFSNEINESYNLVSEIVSASIRRNIFSEKLYEEYGILSSHGIQKRYFGVVKRRTEIEVKKEYLLLNADKIEGNVNIIEENVCRNEENVCRNQTRKVKDSKVKDIKNIVQSPETQTIFERIWILYPRKRGKGQISDAAKKRLHEIGYDEMERAINRYKADLEKDKDWRKPQNGSTFFNSGYVDYLDANYVPYENKGTEKAKQNQFTNFEQRDYTKADYDNMERRLLNRGRGDL